MRNRLRFASVLFGFESVSVLLRIGVGSGSNRFASGSVQVGHGSLRYRLRFDLVRFDFI